MKLFAVVFFTFLLSACQSGRSWQLRVTPDNETQAVEVSGDAADDPALWVDQHDPERSLVLGTQKKSGLYSYHLDGRVKQFLPAGRLNNVDIRQQVPIKGQYYDVVAASNRSNNSISLFHMNSSGVLEAWSDWSVAASAFTEVYGFCMGLVKQELIFVMTGKQGDAELYRLNVQAEQVEKVRHLDIPSQSEGCVIDDQRGDIYVGEESTGVWRFNYQQPAVRELIITVDGRKLKADVEGLALLRHQHKTYLVVSSQGNSQYPIYDLNTKQHVVSIKINSNDRYDRVSGTDGIDVNQLLKTPAYPQGLMMVQDDNNTQPKANQNFKLLSLAKVLPSLQ